MPEPATPNNQPRRRKWIDESWYPETERLIAGYWRAKDRIARLQAKEEALLASLKRLDMSLATLRAIPGLTARYGLVPPSARMADRDYSDLMAERERQLDKIIKEMLAKNRRLASIQHRLAELREWIAPLEVVMERLTPEERILTEQRYIYHRSNYQIAMTLNCSEGRVRYMLYGIITRAAEWLGKDSKKGLRNLYAPGEQKRDMVVS